MPLVAAGAGEVAGHWPESRDRAIGKEGADGFDVVHHVAIANRTRSARVIPGHAADGRAIGRRNIDRKIQSGRTQLRIELVEYDARLHPHPLLFGIDVENSVEVFAGIDDQGFADRLPALRGAGTAR